MAHSVSDCFHILGIGQATWRDRMVTLLDQYVAISGHIKVHAARYMNANLGIELWSRAA